MLWFVSQYKSSIYSALFLHDFSNIDEVPNYIILSGTQYKNRNAAIQIFKLSLLTYSIKIRIH